ncbi:hypothetical protein M8C21_031855, partial [Ambrosia artemisiifolia]
MVDNTVGVTQNEKQMMHIWNSIKTKHGIDNKTASTYSCYVVVNNMLSQIYTYHEVVKGSQKLQKNKMIKIQQIKNIQGSWGGFIIPDTQIG